MNDKSARSVALAFCVNVMNCPEYSIEDRQSAADAVLCYTDADNDNDGGVCPFPLDPESGVLERLKGSK
jgi:hypothetical protein